MVTVVTEFRLIEEFVRVMVRATNRLSRLRVEEMPELARITTIEAQKKGNTEFNVFFSSIFLIEEKAEKHSVSLYFFDKGFYSKIFLMPVPEGQVSKGNPCVLMDFVGTTPDEVGGLISEVSELIVLPEDQAGRVLSDNSLNKIMEFDFEESRFILFRS